MLKTGTKNLFQVKGYMSFTLKTLCDTWCRMDAGVIRVPFSFSLLSVQFSSVPFLSRVQLFATPWTTSRQASLSITISWSSPKPVSIESVMPPNHLILCHPLLPPSIFPGIRVFSNESVLHIRWPKYLFQHFLFNLNILINAVFKRKIVWPDLIYETITGWGNFFSKSQSYMFPHPVIVS